MSDAGELSLGCLIHDLRSALGYSQGRLAERLCELGGETVTREMVSRWECGKRSPGPYWLRHLATALEVPRHVLEDAKVRRREFITTTAAATAIAPIVASDLISSGFAAALNGRPSVDEWEDKLITYGREYMSLGAEEIQRRLAGDLVVLQQQLDDPALWAVAARLMTVYGKTIPGADGAKAIHWYRMAAAAADRSGHDPTRVWVRGRAAIALGYEGSSLPIANVFADQALAIDDRPSLGQLNAIMGKAHVAAIHGDRPTALGLLDQGRRVFDLAGSHEQTSDYAVPEWRMAVFCSLLLARLGDERAALEAQETLERNLPDSLPRFRTHLELHRGLMLVRAGDRPGGIDYARTALAQLPPKKHSLTLRMLLTEIEGPPAP
jgi:transcriptional regulator with XRE-family HTH domain